MDYSLTSDGGMYWHWPTSFGYVVIDDQCDEKDNNDALVVRRNQEFKNEYGLYTAPRLYCLYDRSWQCSHIQHITNENG